MEGGNVSVIGQQSLLLHPAVAGRADGRVIGRSAAMCEILNLVRKIAGKEVPVLLLGELGVGKHTLAREIHRRSPRAAKPFVHILCESLRESDFEERLFGRWGDCSPEGTGPPASLLETSRCGTLFLDGVTRLPLWAQVKLLDALQHSGRNSEDGAGVGAPARVMASSTCELESAVAENRFFSGLYYYLNAVRIDIPPLRHRREDILALAEHFLAASASVFGPPRSQIPRRFSEEARQSLVRYDWPGNVLQLAAVVAHAAMLAEGPEIDRANVAGLLATARPHPDRETISVPLGGSLKDIELAFIKETIRRCRGNKAAAARALGIHRRTLYRLLEAVRKRGQAPHVSCDFETQCTVSGSQSPFSDSLLEE